MSAERRDGGSAAVSVEHAELPLADIERARGSAASVVILPRHRTDDGRGIYGEATVFLAKELRAEGVDVTYLDPSEDRLFEVKKSALTEALVTIALGITSTAGWEAMKALLRRNRADDSAMEITYTELASSGHGQAWTVRGQGKDVIEAIDKLRAEPGEEA